MKPKPGDIVLVNGIEDVGIGVTLSDPSQADALPMLTVDEPTLTMNFQVNTSPFAGREGKFVTSRQLRERLQRELMSNVALRVEETADADIFLVSGRGELHLTILLENMRREGYELAVSKPRVVLKEIDGEKCEPFELLTVDVEETHQGAVMQALGERRGDLQDMQPDGKGRVRLEYRIPARGLIGFQGEFMNLTRGTGIKSHVFDDYGPVKAGMRGAPQRRADFRRTGRGGGLRAVEAAGSRPHVRHPRRPALRRHDHRHPLAATTTWWSIRSRASSSPTSALPAQTKRSADAADPTHPGVRHRVHCRRRTGGDHAQVHPPAQALLEGTRAQTRRPCARLSGRRRMSVSR